MALEYLRVVMVRPHLRDIPRFPLPEGYRLRTYRPGDKDAWLAIWAGDTWSEVTGKTFDSAFGADLPGMEQRCLFLVAPGGRDVGTITVWDETDYQGMRWGRIHWVALAPDQRGKGLSRCLMTAAMHLMGELGYQRAILDTQVPRLNAIRTYLRFGFVPDLTASGAARAWAIVRQHICHPAL